MQLVLNHYTNVVSEKFQFIPMTHATLVQAETFLKHYQLQVMQRETHPAWGVALKIVADPTLMCYTVTLDEQANIVLV